MSERRLISRRDFLKDAGLIISGVAAMSLATACQGAATTTASPATSAGAATTTTRPPSTTPAELTYTQPPQSTGKPDFVFRLDRRYTAEHLWLKKETGNTARMGLSDYGQHLISTLRSILFLPGADNKIQKDKTFGVIEAAKMTIDLIGPVNGAIIEINHEIVADPWLVNNVPWDAGWLAVISMDNPVEYEALLTPQEYAGRCCPGGVFE